MADPIGFYNSGYTGEAIDAAVGRTEQNKKDIEVIRIDIAANQNEISSLKENLETNTNNISNLNGIVAQQSTVLNNKLDKPSGLDTVYKIVTTNNSSTGTLGYTHESTGSTVMQRDANGRAQVEAGTSGKEIVNFAQLQAAIKPTYKHVIRIQRTGGLTGIGFCYVVVYSSNNLPVDSLTDLKTLLGDIFTFPASGYMTFADFTPYPVLWISETNITIAKATDTTVITNIPMTNVSFSDTVTPI